MIERAEIESVAARFGAPDTQIIRDHFISHILAAIAEWPDIDRVTFFGGTALCRTWLPDLRLSEDIDILVHSPTDGADLRRHISRRLRREYPNTGWTRLGAQHQVETWTIDADDLEVRVQLVAWRQGWKAIPTVTADIDLRYSDLPESAAITVPTPSGFAAMKLMAWFDRHTPRDLYDLAALADAGHIDRDASDLVRSIAGYRPGSALERSVPRSVETSWQAELGHQASNISSPSECLDRVRLALDQLTD